MLIHDADMGVVRGVGDILGSANLMAGMKASLAGLIANACSELRASRSRWGDSHAFGLEELQQHIEATVRGEHTLDEFAEYYSLKKAKP